MFYPDWSDPFNVISALAAALGSLVLIVRELYPETRLNYSKFTNDKNASYMVSSSVGMLIIYGPSLSASAYLLLQLSSKPSHIVIISVISFLHYVKRIYEVLHVHRYSGNSKLRDSLMISSCYTTYVFLLYGLSLQVSHVSKFKLVLGITLCLVGETINFYHHLLLSQLRKDGSKEYKIPHEGLFKLTWCPHYTGEIITFIGMVLVSQHFIVLILQLGSAGYLAVRAYNTRLWYKSKFNKIPRRACIIPCVF